MAYSAALARGADVEQIILGARAYANERRGEHPKFIKHPKTWLNGDCWKNFEEPETGKSDVHALAKKILRNGRVARHMLNLELTFPNKTSDQIGLLREAERQSDPDKFLNRWLHQHGPAGVEVGDIS